MECAICKKPVCSHATFRVSGAVWQCRDCGRFGINGPTPIHYLPMYNGKVSMATDVYLAVCKECYDDAILLDDGEWVR